MNDVELGPEEKSLIAAARHANAPTEVQRARVSRGLAGKLAAGVAVPLSTGATALAMVGKIGAGVALVAAVGAGTAYLVTARPAHKLPGAPAQPFVAVAAPSSPPAAVPPPAAAPSVASPVVASQPSPLPNLRSHSARPKPAVQPSETKPAPSVDLAGELGLLTQANAALKRGELAQASQLLDGYDQRFPSGRLAEERAVAGILVLCASGRTQAAGAEARRFLARWPRSPLVARIKASCAAEGSSP